jgi:outer membrane usher protein FimD/PapC
MENIHFIGNKNALSEEPRMDYTTIEYSTQGFFDMLEALKTGDDYHSAIRKYSRNGKIEIPKRDNIEYSHEGNIVNHFCFIRQR